MPQQDERTPYLKLREALDSEAFASLPDEAREAINQDVDELAGYLLENARLAAKGEALARAQMTAPGGTVFGGPGKFGGPGNRSRP
jgi:hypothetical protein